MGDGERIFSTHRGSIVMRTTVSSGSDQYVHFVALDEVLYVPDFQNNIISCAKRCEYGYRTNFVKDKCTVMLNGTMQFQA